MRVNFAAFLFSLFCTAYGQSISGERIAAHVRYLSSDLLEGRGVGSRADALTTGYLAAAFAAAGAKPAGDIVDGRRTYFQRVPLVGVTTSPEASFNGLKYLDEFVGSSQRQKTLEEIESDVVFVGHGISAPEFQWNDYAGANVKGKIVVAFTNEPPSTDPRFFGGKALTYYGRWTYKFEEATRRGARAAILIHTDATAGYGWEVVRNSWGKEEPQVPVKPGDHALEFAGWVTADAAAKLFGRDPAELLKLADQRGFRSLALDKTLKLRIPASIRTIESRNVAAIVEGSDPLLKNEAVVYSAHWDHLGMDPTIQGDNIFNGAIDNASGLGVIVEIARAFAALPQKPRRSILFLAVTAEESGLRGSEYYAKYPLIPLSKTQLNLNFDSLAPYGLTKDIVANGAERTTAYPLLQEAAQRFGFSIAPDPRPEQGSYFRSDHFSFARAGVPAFSLGVGAEYYGPNATQALERRRDYTAKRYHKAADEFQEDWDWAIVEKVSNLGFVLGTNAANAPHLFTWQPGDQFLAVRSGKGQ